jgi:hypothetical protein
MHEPFTAQLEGSPTLTSLVPHTAGLGSAPDRHRLGGQRGRRQPVDDACPRGGAGSPPTPTTPRGPSPVHRRAARPRPGPAAARSCSRRFPGATLDAWAHGRRDSRGIRYRIISTPCRPVVQGAAVEPAKTHPPCTPTRRGRHCPVARSHLAGHQQGADDPGERRSGRKIAGKGCYRDAVHSSKTHVIHCFGLKWVAMMLWVPVPWSRRVWALPLLTARCWSAASEGNAWSELCRNMTVPR